MSQAPTGWQRCADSGGALIGPGVLRDSAAQCGTREERGGGCELCLRAGWVKTEKVPGRGDTRDEY